MEPAGMVMIDIKEIANMGLPDSEGHLLPPSAHQGSLVIMASSGHEMDAINVVISGGIYNPLTGTCGNTCETCNGCASFPPLNPDPFVDPAISYGWLYSQCPWSNGYLQSLTSYVWQWRSSSTSIVTVQASPNPGLAYGVNGGSATAYADLSLAPVNAGQICTQGTLPPCPTANPSQNTPAHIIPVLSSALSTLWYFGKDAVGKQLPKPPNFYLGDVVATITANYASGGSYAWAISDGTRLSFSQTQTVTSTTTTSNTVTVYASGGSKNKNDVEISLTWTDPTGYKAAAAPLSFTVDWPYSLSAPNGNPTVPNTAVSTCGPPWPPPNVGPLIGNWTAYFWQMRSFFQQVMTGANFNESFTNTVNAQSNNIPPSANGSNGAVNIATFSDNYCFANQIAAKPPSLPPQNPLGSNLIWTTTQIYSVGSSSVGVGLEVQRQTLQRFQDHHAVSGIQR
jgi:hypothetical protein